MTQNKPSTDYDRGRAAFFARQPFKPSESDAWRKGWMTARAQMRTGKAG